MARPDLTGILLVGGASRRFGSPKALALWNGQTLAARAWETLGEACGERLAVGKRAGGFELPFPVVDDATATRAALAGIVAGLRRAETELCVVFPVDMPLVPPRLLTELANQLQVTDCYLEARSADAAVVQERPLPAAFFRPSALSVLERRLAAGELALRDALAELETRRIDADPALLTNVNTPADLYELERRTASASSSSSAPLRARPTK
ncbi:MAG TPA: molybdenum cofactor guanylyltransferase [Gaiellaceae bacterium]|nr:molybdenum cofactor guanylyltransferase [Gaiellaceae bacterium]